MPPKRPSSLQSPNPVKHFAQELEAASESPVVPPELDPSSSPPPVPAVAVTADGSVADADVAPSAAVNVPSSPPATPPRITAAAAVPQSPSTPRSRFLDGRTPMRVCCNLDLVRPALGAKLALTGGCVAVLPASTNPDRRYIQLADASGSAGLTIWNDNVKLFGPETVGKLVNCQRLVVTSHNSKRVLSMARDSTIAVDADGQHAVIDWCV
jgi:hypothetical protein